MLLIFIESILLINWGSVSGNNALRPKFIGAALLITPNNESKILFAGPAIIEL